MTSSYINKEGPFQVAGSCDGLVCIYQLDHLYVYVFNPMTGVTRTLTPPRGKKLSVGFGRDVVTGTYKVVVLYSFDRVETLVFDLDTGMWRRRYKTAGPMPLSCTPNPKKNPVFVNGSLFWLMASDFSKILVLDLHTEEFRTVSQPNENIVSLTAIYMWSLEDRLCVNNFRNSIYSDMWVLMQNKLSERWKRTRFDLLRIFPPLPLYSAWFSQTLVSPYQSLSTCFSSRQRQSSTSVQCQ
ncbi:putative F-box protein [Cardamine amara subsp. amara]|uniref:F-box protein n=1 Tax=Cardamine amara subsp. amara TaxID=228776 RepID=A0ABD1BYA6_CARAN